MGGWEGGKYLRVSVFAMGLYECVCSEDVHEGV